MNHCSLLSRFYFSCDLVGWNNFIVIDFKGVCTYIFIYMYVMYVSLQVLREVQIPECLSQLFGGKYQFQMYVQAQGR